MLSSPADGTACHWTVSVRNAMSLRGDRRHCSAGLAKLGVQFTLFAVLLFYLLAAPTDPLEVAVRVLPLSAVARERTIAAFSDALRAVFLSSIKLARGRHRSVCPERLRLTMSAGTLLSLA